MDTSPAAFLFWLIANRRITIKEICQDIDISPDTLLRWKNGDVPNLNVVLNCLRLFNFELVPVPSEDNFDILRSLNRARQNDKMVDVSEQLALLSEAEQQAVFNYRDSYKDFSVALRGRWRRESGPGSG